MKHLFLAGSLGMLFPAFLSAQIIFNEIMYYPDPNEPEWVELYNAGIEATAIEGWTIREDSNSSGSSTTPFSCVIPAGGYVVITGDVEKFTQRWGTIPSQLVKAGFSYLNNNGGDCARLRAGAGNQIDEVCYQDSWGGRSGKSLERLSPDLPSQDSASWGTSVDPQEGTPGRSNSILVSSVSSSVDDGAEVSLFPNPASEHVRVLLPERSWVDEVQIVDINGASLNSMSATSNEMSIDLTDLPSGIYIVQLTGREGRSIERTFMLVR